MRAPEIFKNPDGSKTYIELEELGSVKNTSIHAQFANEM